MKTSSAPRSSSVNPLQERSTSAFSELSAVAVGTAKQAKNHQTISVKYIDNSDVEPVEPCQLLQVKQPQETGAMCKFKYNSLKQISSLI